MNGIRLICTGDSVQTLTIETAMIKHNPKINYKYEEENKIDPVYVDQIGRYHVDEFVIDLILDPEDWTNLMLFIELEGDKYIEYEHNEVLQQYPVTKVTEYPACSDDLHEHKEMTTMKIESRYRTLGAIDFNAAIANIQLSIN